MTADDVHRAQLMRDLRASREVDATDVRVAVCDGVVTLTGEVGSAAERLAIRSIVLADPTTIDLVDHLHVAALPGEWHLSDDQITALVAARLGEHPELREITPTCEFHSVLLRGVVTDPAHRRTAHHLAATTPGVHFVIDRIETAAPARTDAAPSAP